jgi:FtsH-binding integral membrane protein
MNTKEDLQNLLRPQHRGELIVVPRRVLQFAFLSLGILCLGVGIGLSAVPVVSQFGTITFVVCVVAALVLGWWIKQMEIKILKKFKSYDDGDRDG